ncbi:MAG: hypothetical protein R6V36_00190 [Psychroflexus sp.]
MEKLILLFLFTGIVAQAQKVFSLNDCYDLAAENYPLVQQKALLGYQLSTETQAVDSQDGMLFYKGQINRIANETEFTSKIIQTKEERVALVYPIKIEFENEGKQRKACQLKFG